MRKFNVKFTTSLNEEERKAGNGQEITTTVLISDEELETCIERGVKNRIISWQANIKSNWDSFLKGGFPEEIHFSEVPFAGKGRTVTRQPTEQEMADYMTRRIATMTPEQIQEFARTGRLPQN